MSTPAKSSEPEETQGQSDTEKMQAQAATGSPADQSAVVKQLLALLESLNRPIPITFQPAPRDDEKQLKKDINDRFLKKGPVTVAFPPCSDVLLSLINTSNSTELTGFFKDYFTFDRHLIIADSSGLPQVLDPALLACLQKWTFHQHDQVNITAIVAPALAPWPPFWCIPPACVTLAGERHLYQDVTPPPAGKIRRLFIADLIWLFYFERLGIFQILGRLLDDYAATGTFPISNGSESAGAEDDVVAMVLEAMVRQTESGTSSKVRDRHSSYQRSLGWASGAGRKLAMNTRLNTEFNKYFHQFIGKALEFYKDKRLAIAIRSTASPEVRPAADTLTAIGVTLGELKKTLERFDYGRNYSNTLSGIVWVIAGMALVEKLRGTLGIPTAYNEPHEYIPAAYNILVSGNGSLPLETSRYENHKICAETGRDILLDIEVINHKNDQVGGELDLWLNFIESKVEAYRTAYRSLTGADLGAVGTPVIEQQA